MPPPPPKSKWVFCVCYRLLFKTDSPGNPSSPAIWDSCPPVSTLCPPVSAALKTCLELGILQDGKEAIPVLALPGREGILLS